MRLDRHEHDILHAEFGARRGTHLGADRGFSRHDRIKQPQARTADSIERGAAGDDADIVAGQREARRQRAADRAGSRHAHPRGLARDRI